MKISLWPLNSHPCSSNHLFFTLNQSKMKLTYGSFSYVCMYVSLLFMFPQRNFFFTVCLTFEILLIFTLSISSSLSVSPSVNIPAWLLNSQAHKRFFTSILKQSVKESFRMFIYVSPPLLTEESIFPVPFSSPLKCGSSWSSLKRLTTVAQAIHLTFSSPRRPYIARLPVLRPSCAALLITVCCGCLSPLSFSSVFLR